MATLLALTAPPAAAQISVTEIDGHLRVISSDLFEGRAPGTRGEELTTGYLVAWLKAYGVRPLNGSYLQPVRLSVHDPVPGSPVTARVTGRIERDLKHGVDIRLSNASSRAQVNASGELVYVGYGIHSPHDRWDDLGGVDLKGKVVIAELGEPKLEGDTTRFNGIRASRYGRSSRKASELGRRGAIGVLWVRSAGTLSSAPVGGLRQLADDANGSTVFSGNLTDSALAALLPPGTSAVGELRAAAARPGFRAVPLGVTLEATFQTSPREIVSNNVVGTIPGTDPTLAAEHVVLSAHWDHLGIGRPVKGDSIYNGALDDGSGSSMLLVLARHFAAKPEPRSITILFTTAEEWGLLGAEAFVRSGAIPTTQVAANLNLDDGIELWGPKRDVATLGIEHSSLGATVHAVARRKSLRVVPDPLPEEGFFLRSDQLPFAEAGVPSLYMALGTDAVGRPKGWGDEKVKDYLANHYHRPSDEYDVVVVDLAGAVQLAEFVRDVASSVARSRVRPAWLPHSEFAVE